MLVIALVALLIGVAACIAVLLPTRTRERRERSSKKASKPPHPRDVVALSFAANVEVMLDHGADRGISMPDTTRMHVARTLQLAWDENAPIIGSKQRAFVWACVALLAQTAGWITFIALGREVI